MRCSTFSTLSRTAVSCVKRQRTVQIARAMATAADRCLTIDDINPHVKIMEYAVRGPLVIRASEIEKELEQVSRNLHLLSLVLQQSTGSNGRQLFNL